MKTNHSLKTRGYTSRNPLLTITPIGWQSAPTDKKTMEPAFSISDEGKLQHLAWFDDYGPPNDNLKVLTEVKISGTDKDGNSYTDDNIIAVRFEGKRAKDLHFLQFVKMELIADAPSGAKSVSRDLLTTSALKRGKGAREWTGIWYVDSPSSATPFYDEGYPKSAKRDKGSLVIIDKPTFGPKTARAILEDGWKTGHVPEDVTSLSLKRKFVTHAIYKNKPIYEVRWTSENTYKIPPASEGKKKIPPDPIRYTVTSYSYTPDLKKDKFEERLTKEGYKVTFK